MTGRDGDDPRTWPVDLSPDEPTVISQAPLLVAIPLPPPAGEDEPIPEGGWGRTANGWRWQRQDGYFTTQDGMTPEEAAHADDYYVWRRSRAEVESGHGPLTGEATEHHPAPPIALGNATGLIYCKRCGFLLSSDRRGVISVGLKPCHDVPVMLRRPNP